MNIEKYTLEKICGGKIDNIERPVFLVEVQTPARTTFFQTFDKSQYDRQHSYYTNCHTVYMEQHLMAWEDWYVKY